jgi:predicted TIM-barrel fold metal-dependent hydrolase
MIWVSGSGGKKVKVNNEGIKEGIMTKKWLIIDSHNHFIPREATKLACTAEGMDYHVRLKRIPARYEKTYEIEPRLQFMDEVGVDMVVINTSSWSPQGLEMCRALNNGYAEVVYKYPERFIGCAHVPLDGRQETVDELNRAVNGLGFKGVSLVSSTSTSTIDAEEIFPLYERISQLHIPIVVHPTIRVGLWGGMKYGMYQHVSREYDLLKATVEVMLGVLKRFPDLCFIMPHYGGSMPTLKGRVMAWYEPKGWEVPDELKNTPKSPRELRELGLDRAFEEIFSKIYFDTAGFGGWEPITEAAIKTIRADRICFGTDYPFEFHDARDVKEFVENIKHLDISEQDKRNILGENVKRLFKL